ncbi:hypothetical protein VE01_04876 [Pseudogymnoascus verrucosus]|uniref:Protein kinase domain-containing protein n=1 Tax=Pseudogymnoascus verrucosus TaxID=342668 RepID=A0A1B8GML6_9PEZI|nr:uncharacterized protein VE01_04876 [Pseudogymnoascus verrucosus]OBT97073.1 hypothetical protein VE01_04876 [Pseudogymnoascus verrucosus]
MLPFDPSTTKKDDLEAIGFGLSSLVVHVKDTNSVVKTFPPLDKDQDGERRIYEHLQRQNCHHPNILKYFGSWPYQIVSAMDFIHSRGVIRGDIGLHNLLTHDDGGIVLCDFAGSGMEGLPPTIGAGVRYSDPQRNDNMYSTKEDDIFALGTVLYELSARKRLFDGQSS